MKRHTFAVSVGALCFLLAAAHAQTMAPQIPDDLSIHAQDTDIWQFHPGFSSPLRGPASLDPSARGNETVTATLYLGARLTDAWSVYADPEVDQGFGLNNTEGVAGFVNGEGAKVGAASPYLRLQRLFTRYVLNLGGGKAQAVASDQNQVASSVTPDNLTLTAGKFSVVDIFDTNDYAHDPTTDFLNWSIIDAGAFDYPADAWGYSYGGNAELNQTWGALRAGLFDLSRVPNGAALYRGFHSYGIVAELQKNFTPMGQNGWLKLLAFLNRGDMANYTDATRLALETGTVPNVALVRRYSGRAGLELNFEQALGDNLGIFARASINDGHKEAYEFTDINQSLSAGVSIKGALWQRANDTVGLAVAINAIDKPAQDYFGAGGLGILVGDGSLPQYNAERIVETYYNIGLVTHLTLTFDNQYIVNPAYDAVRGPVDVIGARVHAAF